METVNFSFRITTLKKKMIKSFGVPMLDGFKSGIGGGLRGLDRLGATELQSRLTEAEFNYMKNVFLKCLDGAESQTATYALIRNSDIGSQVSLCLKKWKGEYYFNVDGNPISFLTGQNLLGTVQLVKLIATFFSTIENAIKRKCSDFELPMSIVTAIETLNIKIHRLAFACYTPELGLKNWRNISKLVCAIDSVYSAYAALEGMSVKDYLNVRLVKEGEHSIRFDKMEYKAKSWSLAFYNKALELEETGKVAGSAPDWTRNRLRLDLTLSNDWFRRHRCSTLKDVRDAVFKSGGYDQWVFGLFESCLQDLKLTYLLTFNLENVRAGKYEKEFRGWMIGNKQRYTAGCLEFFLEQGLDLTIPVNIHEALVWLTAKMQQLC